jgi:hypothetical protein
MNGKACIISRGFFTMHFGSKNLVLLTICSMLFSFNVIAQGVDWRTDIDKTVQQIDSLSLKSQRTFYVDNLLGHNRWVKETWYYTVSNGKVVIFQVRYLIDSTEYTEIYYMHKDRLICMEEYETSYLTLYDDEIQRGAIFYFVSNTLRQFVTLGAGTPFDDRTDMEYESLTKFHQRYEILQKNIGYYKLNKE